MKKDFTKDFDEIKQMTDIIHKRCLKESISFNDSYCDEDDEYNDFDDKEQEPIAPRNADEEIEAELQDDNSPINQIRGIALKGMTALYKTPEDPQYEVLKKVFSLIDKANDKKAEEREMK
jgi:hypothetical protein